MAERFALYWQPGCTSCLRTKEFLIERGVEFDSFNVLADVTARESLARRGLRSVPVLMQGERYCLAQDLDEVATFVGVDLQRVRLSVDVLHARLVQLLDLTTQLTRQLSPAALEQQVAGRERTQLDLAYHIPMIVRGFLAAAHGDELTYAYYERTLRGADRTLAHVLNAIESTQAELHEWHSGSTAEMRRAERLLHTYFGHRPLWTVLERTTWHVAQHCRQLASLGAGSTAMLVIDEALLAGLPLPQAIWDREIQVA